MLPVIVYILLGVVTLLVVAALLLLKPVKEAGPKAGSVEAFLDLALNAYIAAYQSKKPNVLEGFFSVPCLMDTANRIIYHNVKNFDVPAHRIVKWTCCGDLDNDGAKVWRLDISFKNMSKYGGVTKYMEYGEQIREHWKVLEIEPKVYRVILIDEEDPYDIKNSEC